MKSFEKGQHILFTPEAISIFGLTDKPYEVTHFTKETPSPNIQDVGIVRLTVRTQEHNGRLLLSISGFAGQVNSYIKEVL